MNILVWPKKHKWLSLLLILLIIGLSVGVYDAVSYRFDKRAWFQAKENINTTYADIVARIGQPAGHLSHDRCGGATGPYGEDREILCEVSIAYIYPVVDSSHANKLKAKIRELVNSRSDIWLPSQPTNASSFIPESEGGPTQDYYKTYMDVKCETFYSFNPPFETQLKLKDTSKKVFYASLSCKGDAKGKYF